MHPATEVDASLVLCLLQGVGRWSLSRWTSHGHNPGSSRAYEATSHFFVSGAMVQTIPDRSERSNGFSLKIVPHFLIILHCWNSPEDPAAPALPARCHHLESMNNPCSPALPADRSHQPPWRGDPGLSIYIYILSCQAIPLCSPG